MQIEINEDLKDLIPTYLDSLNQDIIRIDDCLIVANYTEIKSESHRMKGHAGTYGLEYISNMAAAMEYFAENRKSDLIQKTLQQIKTYLLTLEIVFKK